MSSHIKVKVADDGRRVPMEGIAGYFAKGETHTVRDTPFVRRRIAEGDLIVLDEDAPAAAETRAEPEPAAATTGSENGG